MDPCHEGRVGDKLEGGSVYSLGAPQKALHRGLEASLSYMSQKSKPKTHS